MTRDPLADDLARLLTEEPFGLPCRELRRRLGLRLSTVRASLGADPRFQHFGAGRGSRWRLVHEEALSDSWVHLGSQDPSLLALDPSGVPIVGRRA